MAAIAIGHVPMLTAVRDSRVTCDFDGVYGIDTHSASWPQRQLLDDLWTGDYIGTPGMDAGETEPLIITDKGRAWLAEHGGGPA
jgi:hypothetical protein